MDKSNPETGNAQSGAETPDDVAVLYSWAKLQGAKYRDFSASRREYRAQMRHRQAQTERDVEMNAQQAAERSAAEADAQAEQAVEAARFHQSQAERAVAARSAQEAEIEEAARQRALQHAEELKRQAQAERLEASRRAEAVVAADLAARREAQEMAEARASEARQSARYRESDQSVPLPEETAAAAEPSLSVRKTDPYTDTMLQAQPARIYEAPAMGANPLNDEDMLPTRYPQTRDARLIVPQPDAVHPSTEREREFVSRDTLAADAALAVEGEPAVEKAAEDPKSLIRYYYEPRPAPPAAVEATPLPAADVQPAAGVGSARRQRGFAPDEASGIMPAYRSAEPVVPEWLSQTEPKHEEVVKAAEVAAVTGAATAAATTASPVEETLQHSRERVASRWFALKGVFDQNVKAPAVDAEAETRRVPMLTVFSMAGGVGKTSLVATLGRTLSSMGERVLLTDTTSHGLLPFYFGASELKPGVVRTFSPPAGAADAPIAMVGYDVSLKDGSAESQEWLVGELTRNGRGMQRVLLDIPHSASWVARRMARLNAVTLVPVTPDMNSVISLGPMEKFFAGLVDEEGHASLPFYVLNEFDATVPLHLDVREVMRRQLGDRLLPFVIRRSAAVPEALAEGMTVMDYGPEQAVAGDYMNLASWLRTQSAPAMASAKNPRWSEQ